MRKTDDTTEDRQETERERTPRGSSTERGPVRSTYITFRVPPEELEALEKAATEAGVNLSEYLRRAAALRPTTSVLVRPQVNVSVNTPYTQSGELVTWTDVTPEVSALSTELSASLKDDAAASTQHGASASEDLIRQG